TGAALTADMAWLLGAAFAPLVALGAVGALRAWWPSASTGAALTADMAWLLGAAFAPLVALGAVGALRAW
ncbi:hypothetical protein CKW48_21755, partial [Bordetella pertussis]